MDIMVEFQLAPPNAANGAGMIYPGRRCSYCSKLVKISNRYVMRANKHHLREYSHKKRIRLQVTTLSIKLELIYRFKHAAKTFFDLYFTLNISVK